MSASDYMEEVGEIVNCIKNEQKENIETAAKMASQALSQEGLIHTFGTGHSQLVAEEIYFRAGGLVTVNSLSEPLLGVTIDPRKSGILEKVPNVIKMITETENFYPEDIVIIISNSGRNAAPVEMALEMQKKGVEVVAITSLEHSRQVKTTHSSGQKLYQVADLTIDNCAPVGDAILNKKDIPVPFGPVSTLSGVFIIQSIIAETIENLNKKGLDIPLLKSGNLDNAKAYNQKVKMKYLELIKKRIQV